MPGLKIGLIFFRVISDWSRHLQAQARASELDPRPVPSLYSKEKEQKGGKSKQNLFLIKKLFLVIIRDERSKLFFTNDVAAKEDWSNSLKEVEIRRS